MASTVGNTALRTHANGVHEASGELRAKTTRPRSLAKTAEKRPEPRKAGSLVREVMRSAGLSQKAFAVDAGKPESVVSEELHGTRNLTLDAVLSQTDHVFRVTFLEALQRQWGLAPQQDRQARLDVAMALMDRLVSIVADQESR